MASAILRLKKCKVPPGVTEAHNERQKETYKSNPDIKHARTPDNFHIIRPEQSYKLEIEKRITAAKCPVVRKNSILHMEALITVGREFFENKGKEEIRELFEHATDFMRQEIGSGNIFSAVVHMDEKTPHMHLCFTPITSDGRLSARKIMGNRQNLIGLQDRYYAHMSAKYPDLERGKAAKITKRKHVPVQEYKQAAHLDKELKRIEDALDGLKITSLTKGKEQVKELVQGLVPQAEGFQTGLMAYDRAIEQVNRDNRALLDAEAKKDELALDLAAANAKLKQQQAVIRNLPPEVQEQFRQQGKTKASDMMRE